MAGLIDIYLTYTPSNLFQQNPIVRKWVARILQHKRWEMKYYAVALLAYSFAAYPMK